MRVQCRCRLCSCPELVNMAMKGLRFGKSWFYRSCVLFLFALAAGNETRASQNKNNCTYAITIETTCADGAETSDHVAVRFGDMSSTDIVVRRLDAKRFRTLDPLQPDAPLDDVPRKPFRACAVDEFRVASECVESPVCYLYLKLAGSDDWRPGFAKVQVLEGPHLSSEDFYFRRYLPRRVWHGSDSCEKEVTPFGIKSKRKVFATKRFVV